MTKTSLDLHVRKPKVKATHALDSVSHNRPNNSNHRILHDNCTADILCEFANAHVRHPLHRQRQSTVKAQAVILLCNWLLEPSSTHVTSKAAVTGQPYSTVRLTKPVVQQGQVTVSQIQVTVSMQKLKDTCCSCIVCKSVQQELWLKFGRS
jgi:hypothetical protein